MRHSNVRAEMASVDALPPDERAVVELVLRQRDADAQRFPRLLASSDEVLVARETDDDATRPGRVVLRGALPGS